MTNTISETRRRILEYLDSPNVYLIKSRRESLKRPFQLTPDDFLKFARADLGSSFDHRAINVLSNAKRALDCQIESILATFGITALARKQNWGLPRKLSFLEQIGAVTPPILSRVNSRRNDLEHRFDSPSLEAAQDALDVVAIFVEYTNLLFNDFVAHAMLGNPWVWEGTEQAPKDGSIYAVFLTFDIESKIISVSTSPDLEDNDELEIAVEDENFIPFLRKLILIR